MFKMRAVIVTLLPFWAVGCGSLSPQPALSTLALHQSTQPLPSSTDQWWRLYRDPALDRAVEEALINNRDLHVAAAHLLSAQAIADRAKAAQLPATALTASGGYGSTADDQLEAALHNSDTIRTGSRYGIGLDVQWEVDLFGRMHNLRRAANAEVLSTLAEEEGTRVMVAAETTRAWLNACSYAQQAAIAQRSLTLAEQGLKVAEVLHQAGEGSQLDVVRARGLVNQTGTMLPPLQVARRNALAELAVLMGRLPDSPPQPAAQCQSAPSLSMPVMPKNLGMSALSRRPDIIQAQQQLTAATANIGVANADLYPRISLGAGMFSSAHQPADWDKSGATVWSLGPVITWSFPNISMARARIAQAGGLEKAALAHFDGTLLNALKEVQQRLNDLAALQQQRMQLAEAAANSQQALKLAELARKAGAATALDYLDAQRTDITVQHQLANANTQLIDAQVALFKALGGGWQHAPAIALHEPQRIHPV